MTELAQPNSASANVLIVDADSKARAATAKGLKGLGYRVAEAGSAPDAFAFLATSSFDVLILDPVLPRTNGVQVMQRARLMRRDLLIVVLTAHASVESAIAAMRLNVVDYLIKPCIPEDLDVMLTRALEERLQDTQRRKLLDMVGNALSVLNQGQASPLSPSAQAVADAIKTTQKETPSGGLSLDRQKRVVILNTEPPRTVELTEGEMAILIALMEHPNQVMTCNELASAALGYDGMDKWTVENVIRSSVFRLRQKIEPGPESPQLIRTVRGRGYFFAPS